MPRRNMNAGVSKPRNPEIRQLLTRTEARRAKR